ncbi:MAG: hypothetical protein ACLFTE_02190 [Salinivenus sp.]
MYYIANTTRAWGARRARVGLLRAPADASLIVWLRSTNRTRSTVVVLVETARSG